MDSSGAFGWFGAEGTLYRTDPQSQLVMVLMIHLPPNATDIGTVLSTLVYQEFVEAPASVDVDATR